MNALDTPEGTVLLLAGESTDNAVDQLKQVIDHKEINQIFLERTEINGRLASCLLSMLKEVDRTWLALKLVDCPLGPMETNEEEQFLESLPHFERLFLQSTSTNQETSHFILPLRGASMVSSLRLCIRNFDENLSRTLATCLTTSTTLSELCLSGSRRCSAQVDILAQALQQNKSLEKLDLGDCQLNDDCMCRLVTALRGHPKLHLLDLSNNLFADQTLQAIADVLSDQECHLEALDLSLQRRSLNIALIAPALAQDPPSLKHLYISNCGLVESKTFPLIDALTQNQHLETLDISKNRQLTDNFLMYLAERLSGVKLKTLNLLNLQPRCGSPAAMRAICEGLEHNTRMELLRILLWKELVPAMWIQLYINLNRGGRRALEEKIPLALWPLVLERAQSRIYYCPLLHQLNAKDDSIYHLLRNEPALWQHSAL